MALQRDTRYPGRWTTGSSGHPQGAFKNRSAPGALDGSYIEQDWANDWDGFFGSLLSATGLTANGTVDAVGASQYYNALRTMLNQSSPVVGDHRNMIMSVPAASATGSMTADTVIVVVTLGGQAYAIPSFNKTINLATTGAGGMDTGTAPVSGYVAIYAIYNPTTSVSALLATNATATVATEVYGGANMPAGYIASGLLTVLPTNASGQFPAVLVSGREVTILPTITTTQGSNNTAYTSLSLVTTVPRNARKVGGYVIHSGSSSGSLLASFLSGAASGVGEKAFAATNSVINGGYNIPFEGLILLGTQAMFFKNSSSIAGQAFTPFISSYSI